MMEKNSQPELAGDRKSSADAVPAQSEPPPGLGGPVHSPPPGLAAYANAKPPPQPPDPPPVPKAYLEGEHSWRTQQTPAASPEAYLARPVDPLPPPGAALPRPAAPPPPPPAPPAAVFA